VAESRPSQPGSSADVPKTASRASVPPSEPRPSSRASFSMFEGQGVVVGAARLQMIAILILGLLLVAIPLYLWRRPRAQSIAVNTRPENSGQAAAAPPADERIEIAPARVVSCHDPGPKRTSPAECDHVVELEKAFAKAIEENGTCVTKADGGGSIVYLADVSFKRKTVTIATPKESRTLKSPKVALGCATTIKAKLATAPLDTMAHQHARYRVLITATYPGAPK
jgi:hypothetical protein